MDIAYRVGELERKLNNMLILGTITAVDLEQHQVQVISGELTTPWLPWLTQRASSDVSYWAPSLDEQVLVLCPQGEPSLGVVLPALYQNQYPAPSHEDVACGVLFSDGALMNYQKEDHRLTLHLPDEGKIHLHAPDGIFITGNLVVEGHISASQSINDGTRSMDEDRQRFDSHTHTSPETGASTSTPVVSS